MKNVLFGVSYLGTNYSGWQRQDNSLAIQEVIENAFMDMFGCFIEIFASGRTDAGVHAECQCFNAVVDFEAVNKLPMALNSRLPDDIRILWAKEVDDDFHARYNVKEKTYKYILNTGEYKPLERNYVFQYNYSLDIKSMKKAIKYFLGKHDFRAFVTESKEKENCVRTITEAKVEQNNNKLVITFKGDGFLRYQVRNMVGILIRVGENKISTEDVEKILESKDRTTTGKTAPPEGLYLTEVTY